MRARLLWILGIVAGYFVLVAPLLTWMEFSDGIENLNIETSLEMRRGGPWLALFLIGLWQTIEAFWKLTKKTLSDEQRERAFRLVNVAILII